MLFYWLNFKIFMFFVREEDLMTLNVLIEKERTIESKK